MNTVLVTGASSGFGRLIASSLAERGHTVFAGMRDVGGRNAATAATLIENGLQVVELDVTDDASAERAVSSIDGLDVVINNVGGIFPGPVEAFTADEVARQLDLNVLGAVRVNRAALPHLRTQGRGLLVQVGSIAGRVTTPYTGLYAASKAALASLTEAWYAELAPFGIEAVLVEPASYPTGIGANAVTPADADRLAPYAADFGAFMAAVGARSMETTGDPREVAEAVVALVEAPAGERPLRTVVGPADQAEAVRVLNKTAAETYRLVNAAMGVPG